MPAKFNAQEHTAQISPDAAREYQKNFKDGNKDKSIHLLSSSTTFEVGVDLGDLDVAFLRNVPPEPFNYTQRAGRVGRRAQYRPDAVGLAVTYCRRNPHDLYHYDKPAERIIWGNTQPPLLELKNEKLIARHVVAAVLSAFFKRHKDRFDDVEALIKDWKSPRAISDFKQFCHDEHECLLEQLRLIVPNSMHDKLEIATGGWINHSNIAGEDSPFARAEAEVMHDYRRLQTQKKILERKNSPTDWIKERIVTIRNEDILRFLSRKAIIPKYGFPVDVVDLEVQVQENVILQRDLSQAIAEYAPGSKVVANKKVWESHGIKIVEGKKCPVWHYACDKQRNFKKFPVGDANGKRYPKCLIPVFGFVSSDTSLKKPTIKPQRLYATRPYFVGFEGNNASAIAEETTNRWGIKFSKATPGKLVVLCEGKAGKQFHICYDCGRWSATRKNSHKTLDGADCKGELEKFSLGHEFVTDVVRLHFPHLTKNADAYSVAYAILLGAAQALDVPDRDLNVTITGGETLDSLAIVLYDNVPGGAGLVEQLEDAEVFRQMLENARGRVSGGCGCNVSCYGCLRSYHNQFVHPDLRRETALCFLNKALETNA